MIPNFRMLIGLFYEYNTKYFGGVLPDPQLEIIHSYRNLGYFSCSLDCDGSVYNERIQISDNYDYTENQLRDIMMHEMIHYYLIHYRIDMKCSHGRHFKNKASEFNSLYGMNIEPRIDLTDYKLRNGKSRLMLYLSTLL